ncbi:hypothetical protein BR93DRAFT_927176 [Coniochaeta sp. PMI_546]|nr:hypothetical protein BR93DRAFT_927176 [Coniochaeta sp. PMI_546]
MPAKIMEQSYNLCDPATAPSWAQVPQETRTDSASQPTTAPSKGMTERSPGDEIRGHSTQRRNRATSSSSWNGPPAAHDKEDPLSESCVVM